MALWLFGSLALWLHLLRFNSISEMLLPRCNSASRHFSLPFVIFLKRKTCNRTPRPRQHFTMMTWAAALRVLAHPHASWGGLIRQTCHHFAPSCRCYRCYLHSPWELDMTQRWGGKKRWEECLQVWKLRAHSSMGLSIGPPLISIKGHYFEVQHYCT